MVTENLLSTMSQHMNEALQSGVWNQKINQSFIQILIVSIFKFLKEKQRDTIARV